MAEFTHYISLYVYTHHIWRPQGGSSHGAGPWATDVAHFSVFFYTYDPKGHNDLNELEVKKEVHFMLEDEYILSIFNTL
jgi:hypothetical protein